MSMRSLVLLLLTAMPALAQDLPPGLVSAELMPGWVTQNGTRMTALRLELEPGWKTYWRSPGETGVPPVIDWSATPNVTKAEPHWPQPEVIQSDGTTTLGYHDALVLPVELTLADAAKPIDGTVTVDLGLCLNICVPANLSLAAPAKADQPDPRIAVALADAPQPGRDPVSCKVTEIADGLRVAASVVATGDAEGAALELDQPGMWVSQPELSHDGDRLTATAEFVAPNGKPFPMDYEGLRLTVIGADGAVEYQGCTPA